jgi:hypothetical protein
MRPETRTWNFTLTPRDGEPVELTELSREEAIQVAFNLVHGWPATHGLEVEEREGDRELVAA